SLSSSARLVRPEKGSVARRSSPSRPSGTGGPSSSGMIAGRPPSRPDNSPSTAASCRARSGFIWPPDAIERLASIRISARGLISSRNSRTISVSDRAYAPQSRWRISSPGTYSRYSWNSSELPVPRPSSSPERPAAGARGKPSWYTSAARWTSGSLSMRGWNGPGARGRVRNRAPRDVDDARQHPAKIDQQREHDSQGQKQHQHARVIVDG